jgi:DNA-binding transcriptional LysR family regulator
MILLNPPLQAFLAIVEQGTVHGAAGQLRLTQTGVTQRIRALESSLGTTLFLRSRRGMRLTAEGEALLRYCRGAIDLEGQALSRIQGAGTEKPVRVTVSGPTSVMSARVVESCTGLYGRWPGLDLSFSLDDSGDLLAQLRSGRATLAIVPPRAVADEMDSKRLKPERYLLVGPSRWRGRRLTEVLATERIIDFHEGDSTTSDYLERFGRRLSSGRERLFVNSNEAIAKLFAEGVGFGTLTQEVAKPHLDSGRLVALNGGAAMENPLALAWYPRPEMPGYLKAVIESIR